MNIIKKLIYMCCLLFLCSNAIAEVHSDERVTPLPSSKEVMREMLQHYLDCEGEDGLNQAIANIYGRSELHYAALRNDYFNTQLLVTTKEHDINILDRAAATPLALAAEKGNVHIVKYLLENGADPNIKDVAGRSPFDRAVLYKKSAVIEILRDVTRVE